MSFDANEIAAIQALIADAVQVLQGDKGTGLDLGDVWRASQGKPDQIPVRLDEPGLDSKVASVLTPLLPPGEIAEKLEPLDLGALPPEVPDPRTKHMPALSQVWLGRVEVVHDAAVDPTTSVYQTVQVTRVWGFYQTNNDPLLDQVGNPPYDYTPGLVTCWPFPMRHDQQTYNAEVGDEVMVFIGNDGRHYYMRDDLPFVARVIKSTVSTWEDQAGGAGLLSLSVRRQSLSGDPSGAPPVIADLLDALGADIEYTNVLVAGSYWQQHGYRVGDPVWVHRRGAYYFVTPGPEAFLAYLVYGGPNKEAEHTDERYWLREVEATIAYTNNTYTYTYAERSLTDPTGSGGRMGRWCQGVNVSDTTGAHNLPVVGIGSPTTGYIVEVTVRVDPVSGEPWYTFTSGLGMPPGTAEDDLLRWDVANAAWELLPIGGSDYMVLQRKADDTLDFDWVRAHG